MLKKRALVLGAGGFIGNHMVSRLKSEGFFVYGADLKYPEFSITEADEFEICDLRNFSSVQSLILQKGLHFDDVYQFAADMGGAGYVFSGENDADIMHNSAVINLNVLHLFSTIVSANLKSRILYSSSACMYPSHNQEDPNNPNCVEASAYPASPDSEYGWEKLFSERLYLAFQKNYGLDVRIARYHNIFGPLGTWEGGKEKAPAAICRKIALASDKDSIEIWGDGEQTRSFLFIDECVEATRRLMRHNSFVGPVNIGSEEMVTINELARITAQVAGKQVSIVHTQGPTGVRGRNSSNVLIREKLGWDYSMSLKEGIEKTYHWILDQVQAKYHSEV